MALKTEDASFAGKKVPCAMTIAGSDSGGGAGVEADLKTFSALGVYGTCAITAITAQNTCGVFEVFPVPPAVVKRQIDVVLKDIPVEVAKTGMLYSRGIMEVVSESIDKYGLKVIVDPVLRAGTGSSLTTKSGKDTLVELIVPKAYILTPNVPEAELISNLRIESLEDMKEAAQRIAYLGAKAVIVKGGHLKKKTENVFDVFYCEGALRVFKKPWIRIEAHGSGCVFSAAVTANLALGLDLTNAIEKSEQFIEMGLRYSLRVGGGRRPVNPMIQLYERSEIFHVLEEVEKAAETIENHPEFLPYIAEVGTQVGMALPHPLSEKDVAAIDGRIVRCGNRAKAVGPVHFEASQHVARIILTVMRHNPEIRAALNLHYDPGLVDAFKRSGFKAASFDRSLEPPEIKFVEGGSLVWGTEEAIRSFGEVPDIVYDEGDVGKEPMIRVLGKTATETASKALASIKVVEKTG